MRIRISRRTGLIILAVICVLIVVACALINRAVEEVFANIRMADCAWNATVVVWEDANRDGLQGEGEAPLPNVTVYADDTRNNIVRVASDVTDETGTAALNIFIAGCPETAFEVYAEPTSPYCATTPERLSQSPFEFGLALCES